MRVDLDSDGAYFFDQGGAIRGIIPENRLADARSTLAPIVADCHEIKDEDIKILGVTSAAGLPTIKYFQSLVKLLMWVA